MGVGRHAGPLCSEVASTFGDPHTVTVCWDVQAADRGNGLVAVLSIAAKKQQRFFPQNQTCVAAAGVFKIEGPLGEAVSALC